MSALNTPFNFVNMYQITFLHHALTAVSINRKVVPSKRVNELVY